VKAVRSEQGRVFVANVETPRGEGVRVKVASSGICGSDLHMLSAGFPMPFTMGHESAGTAPDGTPVAIEPIVACGHCAACVRGAYNLCERGAQFVGINSDGGMAEEVLVPARCLVPLPSGIPLQNACLNEPIAVAVHGVARAGIRGGERVAIVGGGTIGLCALAVVKEITPNVSLNARHDAQKAAAERLGAKLDAQGSFDVVIDCAGTSQSIAEAVGLCRPGATLLLLATYWEGLTLPAFEVSMKELRILGSNAYCRHGAVRDVEIAAALMARNPLIAPNIISHRLPLEAAVEAFQVAGDRRAGAIKVTLVC